MKKTLTILLLSLFLFSCGEKKATNADSSSDELAKLKKENETLKEELDLLKGNLSLEAIEPIVFKTNSFKKAKAGEPVKFIIGALYNRPNYFNAIYGKIYEGVHEHLNIFDSITPTSEYLLDTIQVQEDEKMSIQRTFSAEFDNLKKGKYTFAGMIGLKKNNEDLFKPFLYILEVE